MIDKSATSPFASGKRGNRRRRGKINEHVTGFSRTCRGRHGKVGIVEFGLYWVCCCPTLSITLTDKTFAALYRYL